MNQGQQRYFKKMFEAIREKIGDEKFAHFVSETHQSWTKKQLEEYRKTYVDPQDAKLRELSEALEESLREKNMLAERVKELELENMELRKTPSPDNAQ